MTNNVSSTNVSSTNVSSTDVSSTEQGSFYRKITYLALIAVLLFPLSQLGAPKTRKRGGDGEAGGGGKLAQMRADHNLGSSNLGKIDPTSAAMRMATLGARGIAVSWLWSKAIEYKKKEDWTNFRATLSQLANLQPYFISFWRYQSWNLSYNVSVELDDVGDRFHYVKRGIEFLKEGTLYNRDSPYLLAELGWFIGNKIGKADEHVEYRQLFKHDDDFHNKFFDGNPPPREQRDNWLVSGKQYNRAISAVDDKKKSLGQKNPTTFYNRPGMSQINYSEAIEKEGTFGDSAKEAWRVAEKLWHEYGNRELKSSRGFYIRLAGIDRLEQEARKLEEDLENIAPDLRKKMESERLASLTAEQREVLAVSPAELSEEQSQLFYTTKRQLEISWQDLAARIAVDIPDQSTQARKMASRLAKLKERITLTNTNRDVSNYAYWDSRCHFEQTSAALKGRALAYAGRRAFKEKADLIGSRRLYEESFALWAALVADYPVMLDDSAAGADIMEFIDQYSSILEQLDKSLADEDVDSQFPLWNFLELNDSERKYPEAISAHRRRAGTEQPPAEPPVPDVESQPDRP